MARSIRFSPFLFASLALAACGPVDVPTESSEQVDLPLGTGTVTSFDIYDASASKPVGALGSVVALSTLPSGNITITARTTTGSAGTLQFTFNGGDFANYQHAERVAPYSLFGDSLTSGGDYTYKRLKIGHYTLKAAFGNSDKTVEFDVVATPIPTPTATPSPSPSPTSAPTPAPTPAPSGSTQTIRFTEDPGDILNPERGIYRTGVTSVDGALEDYESYRKDYGSTLAYDRVYFDQMSGSFSEAIARMEKNLAGARSSGVKLVLRFAYGKADGGPSNLTTLIGQGDDPGDIAVFKDVLHKYQDVIAYVEAGFVGHFGEWHHAPLLGGFRDWDNEPYQSNANAILDKVMLAVPSSRMVAVRYPKYLRGYLGLNTTVTAASAYTGTNIARAAHHNDCFLFNSVDNGTYLSELITTEKNYTALQTEYTFTAGETCGIADTARATCANALAEGARFHWATMNDRVNSSAAEKAVVEAWKAGGCWETIKRKLGYRFVMVDATLPTSVRRGTSTQVTVRLRNDGWARPYNSRTAYLVLSSGSTRRTIALTSDPQLWAPGQTTTINQVITIPADVPAEAAGTAYKLGLWLPDEASTLENDARFAIRFANTNTWSDTTGINTLGSITVVP